MTFITLDVRYIAWLASNLSNNLRVLFKIGDFGNIESRDCKTSKFNKIVFNLFITLFINIYLLISRLI